MKTILLFLTSISFLITVDKRTESIYQYELNTIEGESILLSDFEGDVLLIVNTASKCGYTPQYEGLQELYEQYSGQGFKVLGFPANNFGGQEPGTNEEIAQFCEVNYRVTFPMFSKVSVKGEDQHPLFTYLTGAENPDFKGEISWNFEKFLIDRNGRVVRRFKNSVEPMSEELTSAIAEYL